MMRIRSQANHIDLATLVVVLILMVSSLGVVYSASASWAEWKTGESAAFLGRHAVKVLLGFLAIFLFLKVDYRVYRAVTKPLLVVAIVLLGLTLGLGGEVKGASRWLRLGGLGFQPSEFARYAVIFHLCTMLAAKKDQVRQFSVGYLPMLIWIGAVTTLVLLQPNFSTGAMIFGLSFLLLYVGRAKLSHIALTFAALVPVLLVYMVSKEYRMQRILGYLGSGSGGHANYQLQQGMIGFGNGGIFGVGPGMSRQRDLFLPESYGDFVFSIVGEEYGLIGTLCIITLFLVILLRGMRIARHARDEFGRYLAVGITASITLYALVNAGVTLGILPTTGLPMPFVSYGGTAMLFSCAAIGVLLNISSQTDLHPRVVQAPDNVRPAEPRQAPAVGSVY